MRYALLFKIFTALVVSVSAHTAHSHGSKQGSGSVDDRAVWALSVSELAVLEQTIQQHRQRLITALQDATVYGFPESELQRPYLNDSNDRTANIPRSVLNRVIMASIDLETEQMRKYFFCEGGCDHSLFKDLEGDPEKEAKVTAMRKMWLLTKGLFRTTLLELPLGIWTRVIHISNYASWLRSSARYESRAYGTASMAIGAATFGLAYGASEALETVYLSVFHSLCKVNYIWSAALGSAVATFSRDMKSLLRFEKDERWIVPRIFNAASGFMSLYSARQLESRVNFKTNIDSSGVSTSQKLNRKSAGSILLEAISVKNPSLMAVAADQLLWSEVAWSMVGPDPRNQRLFTRLLSPTTGPTAPPETKLLDQELQRMLGPDMKRSESALRWQDLNASLRTMLKMFRDAAATQQMIRADQAATLKILGQLDMQLRALDIFMRETIRRGRGPITTVTPEWLKNIIGEWMSISIDATGSKSDPRSNFVRVEYLSSILELSTRQGKAAPLAPEGYARLKNSLASAQQSIETPQVLTCENLFVAVP